MNDLLAKHIDSHSTAGHIWPDNAILAVKYNLSTWPLGWSPEAQMVFFASIEEFEAWKATKHQWALCEDNHVAYAVYEWNLGPYYRDDMSHDPGNVGLTYEEKHPAPR